MWYQTTQSFLVIFIINQSQLNNVRKHHRRLESLTSFLVGQNSNYYLIVLNIRKIVNISESIRNKQSVKRLAN